MEEDTDHRRGEQQRIYASRQERKDTGLRRMTGPAVEEKGPDVGGEPGTSGAETEAETAQWRFAVDHQDTGGLIC